MNFHESKALGKKGESIFRKRLDHQGITVVDVTEHRWFQEWDIDFVVQQGDHAYTIDVKTDSYRSNNFFIETISNDNKHSAGCIYQSRADLWVYIFAAVDEGYVFNPRAMVKHIEENQYREKNSATTNRLGRHLYNSVGVLVPISNAPVLQRIENISQYEPIAEQH